MVNHRLQKLTRHAAFHFVLLSAVLFVLAWFMTSPLVFSTSDAGLRYLQIRSLVTEQWQSLAIHYPVEIDPAYRYAPYYYAYSLINGRLYFNISPFYPILASFLYAGAGLVGLAFSPVIGALLNAWGALKLARAARLPHPRLVMWATIFASPLLFYSTQVWDHTLGTGLAVAGVALAAEGRQQRSWRRVTAAGLFLGFSMGQRPELYLFTGALGIAWMVTNGRQHQLTAGLVGGGLAGIIPLWILQQIWVGHFLGLATATNLLGYGRPAAYLATPTGLPRSVELGNFLLHINARDPATFSAAVATLVGTGLFFFALRVPRYRSKSTIWSAALLILYGVAVWSVIAWQNMVTGLISTLSLFGISIVYAGESEANRPTHSVYRFVFITFGLYLAGMLFFWPAFGARVWGSRYLLTAYPLLVFLAFYNLHVYKGLLERPLAQTLQRAFTVLLITGIVFQFLGVRFNYTVVTELAASRDSLANASVDALLTNQPFYPALIMGAVEDVTFAYAKSGADVRDLIPRLYAHGARRVTTVMLESDQLAMPDQVENIRIIQTKPFTYELRVED